ncbi:MAG: efflux RND transporter periplasmic adaptor subunit [Ignavibacteria bacterium]|nr:efflux RND transporter periplasmic adaptor subunit [Ignavibacteria bacterium]
MKLKPLPIVILIVVLALAYAVQHRITHGTSSAPPTTGGSSGKGLTPPQVHVIVVQPETFVDTVQLTGSVSAENLVDIRSEISGRVVKILFQEGRDVAPGQLLVKLNDADLQAKKSRILTQLQVERKRIERLVKLKAVDGVSEEDYEAAVAAEAMRTSELAEVQAQIEKTELRAPFAGKMGLRMISNGAVVSSATLISTLTSTNALNTDFRVPERYIASLRIGSKVGVRVRGMASAMFHPATVTAIEPELDPQTRTQRVRAKLSVSSGIASGQYAEVLLQRQSVPDAILVPTESVVQDMRGATVFRVRGGAAEKCDVELGSRTANKVHIMSGIHAGDTVITSGILFVKPGKPVEVTNR